MRTLWWKKHGEFVGERSQFGCSEMVKEKEGWNELEEAWPCRYLHLEKATATVQSAGWRGPLWSAGSGGSREVRASH